MDFQQEDTTQPISDDQELAKALAGISPDPNTNFGGFEATPLTTTVSDSSDKTEQDVNETVEPKTEQPIEPIIAPAQSVEETPASYSATAESDSNDLDEIKKDALVELRPLVDKLDLEPQEKFDIYLLLLRSTDDKTLIASAHAAAQAITDESKRAQALLDVIREIDYLSSPKTAE